MYYVIQENLFREYHFNSLIDYLKRYGLEYEIVKYKPFVHEVEVKTERKDVWFFGSINTGMALKHKDWKPGIIYNKNFDFDIYLKKYGENLLNSDGVVEDFGNIIDWELEEYFIRPTRDTKTFESNLYTEKQWDEYIYETIRTGTVNDIVEQTKILYASPKPIIQQEIRCWIIDGEPITMSQYRIGKRFNLLNMDHNEEAYIFAKDMAKIYSPARAFVLDICLYNDEYKIVELGCIHHCGFYDANMSKLIQALEKTFG